MNYVHRKASVLAYFSYLLICVFLLTLNPIKNIPNVDFMAILMKLATCHVRNAFKRPLRPNAPTVRVLTSVIFKGNWMGFQQIIPHKNPRHGAPGSIGSSTSVRGITDGQMLFGKGNYGRQIRNDPEDRSTFYDTGLL